MQICVGEAEWENVLETSTDQPDKADERTADCPVENVSTPSNKQPAAGKSSDYIVSSACVKDL